MTNLIKAVNTINLNILVERTVSQVVANSDHSSQYKYIISAMLFKGFLIDISLKDNRFLVHIVSGNAMYCIFTKNTTYSWVNFSKYTKEWLVKALTNKHTSVSPHYFAKRMGVKPFENFTVTYHGLRTLQRKTINNYKLGIRYL